MKDYSRNNYLLKTEPLAMVPECGFVQTKLQTVYHLPSIESYEFTCLRLSAVGGPMRFVQSNGDHLTTG